MRLRRGQRRVGGAGGRYELELVQEAASPPGPASFPNMPPGTRASVTSFTMQSKGTLSGDLTRIFPASSTVSGSGDGTFAVTSGADRSTLRQQMTIETTMSRA